MTTALVMTWADTKRKDFRALVDIIDADGDRHPYGAARGDGHHALGEWIKGIVADAGATSIQYIDCGEVEEASFLTIRAIALVREAREVGV
jgi:hypothetical protein